jgi:Ulp1 family protease
MMYYRPKPRWASLEDVPFQVQKNDIDCGVFVLMYAALLFRGNTPRIMKQVCW